MDETPFKLPIRVQVPFPHGECPSCKNPIVHQVTVEIKSGSVRIAGGTNFLNNLDVTLTKEVVAVTADHECYPNKRT